MGSELQGKYQRLAQEYAKLRSHVDILKKAVKEEKSQRESLQEVLREKTLSLRKHVQENESLEFRNQQLSKRVEMLQGDLDSPMMRKKKKAASGVDGVTVTTSSDVQTQELAAKIAENAQLHLRISELAQKSETAASALQAAKSKLESEVSAHTEAMEGMEREHKAEVDAMTTNRAMLEAKLAKQSSELSALKATLQREQELGSRLRESSPIGVASSGRTSDTQHYAALNVPVVDAKLQSRVLVSLKASLELITAFATQLSTLHSYLQQRCKIYPIDTATGAQVSTVNGKLCKLLHSSSSSYTKPLVSVFSKYYSKLHINPYTAQTSGRDLLGFALAHRRLVAYLDTLTPYLQLSLQEECNESVCGVQLTDVNIQLSSTLPRLVSVFYSTDSYLSLLARGPVEGVPVASLPVCLQRLKLSFRDLHNVLEALHNLYSSKITFEYQLPNSSQNLNTTNECIVSVLSGLALTALQTCELLEEHGEVFSTALAQSTPVSSEAKSSTTSVVQRLRQRATNYIHSLNHECPGSVPYTLALYHARCMSSSSENRETLSKQVVSSQEMIVRLEQEKERSKLDLQLLTVKYEKEKKKVERLETDLSHHTTSNTLSTAQSQQRSLSASRSSLGSNPPHQSLSESVGSLAVQEEEANDEAVREELIRKHFTERILQVKAEAQEVDSKAAHYYAESRAIMKQLNHNTAIRGKLSQDLDSARDTIQQLQDQLATTSSSYEKQLSTMSDHLCELNDKMLKQTEEVELLRRNKGKRWGK